VKVQTGAPVERSVSVVWVDLVALAAPATLAAPDPATLAAILHMVCIIHITFCGANVMILICTTSAL